MSPPVRPMSNRGLETHMTDKPAAGDLDREVRAALEAVLVKGWFLNVKVAVPVVVRLIEAHRAPLIAEIERRHQVGLSLVQRVNSTAAEAAAAFLRAERAGAAVERVRALCGERDDKVRDTGVPGSKAIESLIAAGGSAVSTTDVRAALDGAEETR
jgi:hypothetical protein